MTLRTHQVHTPIRLQDTFEYYPLTKSCELSLSFGVYLQNTTRFSFLPWSHMLRQFHPPLLENPTNIQRSTNSEHPHNAISSSFLLFHSTSKHSPRHPVLEHPQATFVLHTHTKQVNCGSVYFNLYVFIQQK